MRVNRSRGKRVMAALASGSAAAAILASVPGLAIAAPVLDANCPGPAGTTESGLDGNQRYGTRFTAQTTGTLVQGEMEVRRVTGTSDWTMEIYATDIAGNPTDGLLASTTIPDASVPSGPTRIVGVFATPANVLAGRQYVISLRRGPGSFSW